MKKKIIAFTILVTVFSMAAIPTPIKHQETQELEKPGQCTHPGGPCNPAGDGDS